MQNTTSADLNAGPRRQVASSGRGPKSQGQNNLCVRAKIELYQFITVQYHKSAAGAGRSRFLRFHGLHHYRQKRDRRDISSEGVGGCCYQKSRRTHGRRPPRSANYRPRWSSLQPHRVFPTLRGHENLTAGRVSAQSITALVRASSVSGMLMRSPGTLVPASSDPNQDAYAYGLEFSKEGAPAGAALARAP
jgi:hypothetical protein